MLDCDNVQGKKRLDVYGMAGFVHTGPCGIFSLLVLLGTVLIVQVIWVPHSIILLLPAADLLASLGSRLGVHLCCNCFMTTKLNVNDQHHADSQESSIPSQGLPVQSLLSRTLMGWKARQDLKTASLQGIHRAAAFAHRHILLPTVLEARSLLGSHAAAACAHRHILLPTVLEDPLLAAAGLLRSAWCSPVPASEICSTAYRIKATFRPRGFAACAITVRRSLFGTQARR